MTIQRCLTFVLPLAAAAAMAFTPACGDDDDDGGTPTQGSSGASGRGNTSGTGGGGAGQNTGGGGAGGVGGGGLGGSAGGTPVTPPPNTPAAFEVLALDEDGKLFTFTSDAAGPAAAKSATITGAGTEKFVGLDVRSSDGVVYGLTDAGKLYKVTVDTSGATVTATAAANPVTLAAAVVIGEGGIAFDFNPKSAIAADKGGDGGNALRVITEAKNYRLNPVNGGVAGEDPKVAYKAGDPGASGDPPKVVAAGYLNAYKGTTTTVLYYIDTTKDALVQQSDMDPNTGVLATIGSLGTGVTVGDEAGFDIVTTSNATSAAIENNAYLVSGASFYKVDLGTGTATKVGADVAGAAGLRGLAVRVPAP